MSTYGTWLIVDGKKVPATRKDRKSPAVPTAKPPKPPKKNEE